MEITRINRVMTDKNGGAAVVAPQVSRQILLLSLKGEGKAPGFCLREALFFSPPGGEG
jgi:hypothetical protein